MRMSSLSGVNMRTALALTMIGAIVVFATTGVAQTSDVGDVRTGPAPSPLHWTDMRPAPPDMADALHARAVALLGDSTQVQEAVSAVLSDSSWMSSGVPSEVWRVAVRPVLVHRAQIHGGRPRADESRRVALNLVLEEGSLSFLFACTDPRAEWVLPADGAEDGGEGVRARVDSWCERIEPVGSHVTVLSVADVLGELWGRGLDPAVSGLTVVRPRWVLSKWPVKSMEVGGGPNETPRAYWLCESHGLVVPTRASEGPRYASGKLTLICDEDPEVTLQFLVQ